MNKENEDSAALYPYIDYKNPNPALSDKALKSAIEWRRPAFFRTDSFYLWRKYLEDDVDHVGSFGGPYTFGKADE